MKERISITGMQVDPSFEGLDGGEGSLIKWNPLANIESADIWNFLRVMHVPYNSLHSQVIIFNCSFTLIVGKKN